MRTIRPSSKATCLKHQSVYYYYYSAYIYFSISHNRCQDDKEKTAYKMQMMNGTLDAVQKLNSLSDTCAIFLSLCSQVQCVLILRGFLLLACFCYTNFNMNMKQCKITPNKCHLPTSKRPPFIKRLRVGELTRYSPAM